ncbi:MULTISPECIES: DinB family protein [unclassified Solwaraspora]|uniref:DinB family protein n=1 Tax=unclassified Solwaraspora TaxID=2627926 RepID=UPI00248C90AE|nr:MULTISPECIES: DinB family protein [unclassified Solwaraspora]WBB98569.1 DinB family protein [Solwaraspora sp. WMMA2059]WBC22879.1 DinB family protein [Solwaraspora sp. WMMA2080]WJK35080.1 DinB family protein [Solwaraspora sp. WMMA2065]
MTREDVTSFVDRDLRGARFNRSTLAGAVMRGVDVRGLDIDAPWLADGALLVNGVDVVPLVEAELNRRFPGRELMRAEDPDGLRTAWRALELAWAAAVDRIPSLPEGAVDVSVDGEWSFAQTLRHLVFATDAWLGKAILRLPQPFHPLGQPHAEYELDGFDMSIFATEKPALTVVLQLRAERQAMVREFLTTVTADLLAEPRPSAWSPEHDVSVLHCLHVILDEEWSHLRYALRDLDVQG